MNYEEASGKRLARCERQIELLERMIEDRSRDIFMANEELEHANQRLTANVDELKSTQRALVDASRKAGMADVATSVLHNIGNVLNSANVSANVVAELARTSRSSGVGRAVALLRAQPDPGRFLNEDPRGKKLLDYLEGIGQALDASRTRAIEELACLERSIEHIKAIVTTQQSHARGGAPTERIDVRSFVDDAVRMSGASFDRRDITANTDYSRLGDVTEICIDRHKLLQILINLLTNAAEATDTRAEGRRLTVRVAALAPDRLTFEVDDNGVGIDSAHLTKIFAHGFTTKPEGHGFGLHASACAAVELGGSLNARSTGPGCGATFTLVVPRQAAVTSAVATPQAQ